MINITFLINYYIKKEQGIQYNNIEKIGIICLTLVLIIINHLLFPELFSAILNDIIIICLLILSFVDLKVMIIPDFLNLCILIVSIINLVFNINIIYGNGINIILNVVFCLIIFFIVLLFYIIKKIEIFGIGDIKLLFAVGFYIGFNNNLYVLFLASLICLLVVIFFKKMRKKMIPFGPFISIAILFIIFS